MKSSMEFWERLARAEAHALRIRILEKAQTGAIVSPAELSVEWDEPLGNVSYHVKALAKSGMLTLDHTEPKRGALQHFYRLGDAVAVPA